MPGSSAEGRGAVTVYASPACVSRVMKTSELEPK